MIYHSRSSESTQSDSIDEAFADKPKDYEARIDKVLELVRDSIEKITYMTKKMKSDKMYSDQHKKLNDIRKSINKDYFSLVNLGLEFSNMKEFTEKIDPETSRSDAKRLKVGAKVVVHEGKYKGQVGTIVDMDYPDEDDDTYQLHVKMKDKKVRYLGLDDVSFTTDERQNMYKDKKIYIDF